MQDEQKGFKVKDRRLFTSEGELRTSDDVDAGGAPAPATAPPANPQAPAHEAGDVEAVREIGAVSAPARPAPAGFDPGGEVSFASFVISLATQAGALLESEKDLAGARHFISILEMLSRKTEGRREPDEDRILEHLLFELRMAYVERARAAAS